MHNLFTTNSLRTNFTVTRGLWEKRARSYEHQQDNVEKLAI